MKRIIKMLVLILILIIASSNVFAATIYAPDGRTAQVEDWEVKSYEAVGWYSYPVVTMYAPDGRSIVVSSSSVASWENVGWIDGRKTTTIYAPDGRTATIPLWQVGAYKAVGWYDYPVNSSSSSSQNYTSYYPNSIVPTFESITGQSCVQTLSNDRATVYMYYASDDEVITYCEVLGSTGWSYYDIEKDYANNKATIYYTKGLTLVSVSHRVDTNLTAVAFGTINL